MSPPVSDSATASVEPDARQQVEHDRLHRLVVDAEHQIAEQAAQAAPPRRRGRRRPRRRSSAFAVIRTLSPSIARRQEREGRVADGVELDDARRQHLGQTRLATRPRSAASGSGSPTSPGPSRRSGRIVRLHHLLHLPRHPGHRVDHLVADCGHRSPGAVPGCGLEELGAVGRYAWSRLLSGMWRSRPRNIQRMRSARSSSNTSSTPITRADRLPGDVVLGRAQAAAADDRIAALERPRSRSTIRSRLSPTLVWKCGVDARQARAARRSTTSWCRRSGRAAAPSRWRRPHSASVAAGVTSAATIGAGGRSAAGERSTARRLTSPSDHPQPQRAVGQPLEVAGRRQGDPSDGTRAGGTSSTSPASRPARPGPVARSRAEERHCRPRGCAISTERDPAGTDRRGT